MLNRYFLHIRGRFIYRQVAENNLLTSIRSVGLSYPCRHRRRNIPSCSIAVLGNINGGHGGPLRQIPELLCESSVSALGETLERICVYPVLRPGLPSESPAWGYGGEPRVQPQVAHCHTPKPSLKGIQNAPLRRRYFASISREGF